ncbi:hypothetical protein Trydic_g14800 [Trypoxylus dichotomus]
MLCSSIKLTDRREFRQEKTPKRNRSTMLEEKLFVKSDYYHSYTFRWDKPKKRHYSCNNPQFLTIKDIIFPESLSCLNDPPSKEWLKRTPRIKSIDVIPKINEDFDSEEGLSVSVLTDQLSRETEELIEEIKSSVNFEDEENDLDPDIQQLITSTRETVQEKEEDQLEDKEIVDYNINKKIEKKRRHLKKKERKNEENEEKKDKNKEKDSERTKSKTKTIKFSLSKPPTPQTLEVIRVDVTSNFSVEEELPETCRTASTTISDCSKGCGMKILRNKEIKENLHKKMSASMELSSNEVNFMCRRVILKDRSDDIAK